MDSKKSTEALNQIPIQDVAAQLGINIPKTGSINCPFPDHEDKKPSFQIHPSGTRWTCYGCGRSGGSIDFVKEYNRMDFLSAKNWLQDRKHKKVDITSNTRRTTGKKIDQPDKQDSVSDSSEHLDVYTFLLSLCPLLESGHNYLLSRAITTETQKEFKVAQMPSQSILPKLINEFTFERIYAAGLLTQNSIRNPPRLIFPLQSVIFPFLESGKVVYLQARTLRKTKNGSKWLNLFSRPRRIYNLDAITQESKQPFAICEGIIDTLSAIEFGYSAVGIMGVTAGLTQNQILALRKKEVEILLDWDEKGEERAQSLQKELDRYGVVSIRKKLPSTTASDLNDYLKEKRKRA